MSVRLPNRFDPSDLWNAHDLMTALVEEVPGVASVEMWSKDAPASMTVRLWLVEGHAAEDVRAGAESLIERGRPRGVEVTVVVAE